MEARECAIKFTKNLTMNDKSKMLKMISHGVMCGMQYAKDNEADPILFNNELKNLLGGNR